MKLWSVLLVLLPLGLSAQENVRWDLTGSVQAAPLLPYDLRPAWAAAISLGGGRSKFNGNVRQAYLVEFGRSRRQTTRYENAGPDIADGAFYIALRYQMEFFPFEDSFEDYGVAFELGYQNSPDHSFTNQPPQKSLVKITPQWGILTGLAFVWRINRHWHLHTGFRLSAYQIVREEIQNGQVKVRDTPFDQFRHVPMLRLNYRLPLGSGPNTAG